MKKSDIEELREEYDLKELGKGTRGKYYKAYREGANLLLLPPDVAKKFPTQEAVTKALRWLIEHKLTSTVTE